MTRKNATGNNAPEQKRHYQFPQYRINLFKKILAVASSFFQIIPANR